jgi:uncharacterized protein YcbX
MVGTMRRGDALGAVSEIHRYPVKSMAGEMLPEARVDEHGLIGDRAFALFDPAEGRAATAKRTAEFPGLMDFRARYLGDQLNITHPDGRTFPVSSAECSEALCRWFGRRIEIGARSDPPERRPVPGRHAMKGTFFDYAPLHLVTTTSMTSFAARALGSILQVRRFRPNLVLECDARGRYPENEWVGRTLQLGAEVLLEVTDPCPRCVMITLPQGDLPKDPSLLKVLALENIQHVPVLKDEQPCLGVYAFVKRGGVIRQGDQLLPC